MKNSLKSVITSSVIVVALAVSFAPTMAAKFTLKTCTPNEVLTLDGEISRKLEKRYEGKEPHIAAFAATNGVPYWRSQRLMKWCDDAAAGKSVDISCQADRSNIDYNAVDAMFPANVMAGDLNAYIAFRKEFFAKHGNPNAVSYVTKAIDYCREKGVME